MRPEKSHQRNRNSPEEEYFLWLCAKVNCKEEWIKTLRELYETPFFFSVANDDNRGNDGFDLRDEFLDEHLLSDRSLISFSNVLEVLVAIAQRMDFILFDPDVEESQTPEYFWELIENLKLLPNSPTNRIKISKFLNRKYSPEGVGGIFPLNDTERDQREVEIWYQMQEYITKEILEDD